jgi:hypothetical protein
MSRNQIVENEKELRLEIVKRYQQHKADILDFTQARDSTTINLITLANSKILTFYDDSHRIKYQQ